MIKTRPVLTPRQEEIYRYIRRRILANECPSIREIGKRFGGMYPNGVRNHLMALQKKGYIDWREHESRTITLTCGGASLPDLDGHWHDFSGLLGKGR